MIDQFSISLVTAVVVLMCAVLFLFDTLLRRPDPSGRLWAAGFLSAVLTTLFYLVWAAAPETAWAIVGGNICSVVGTGLMWLGCRAYNRRRVVRPGAIVATGALAAGVAAGVELGAGGDDWSGSFTMFVALSVFAAAASVECFRGALGSSRTALPLGLVFAIQAVFYGTRVVVVASQGYGEFFHAWVGTVATSILTVVLSITAVVTASVLRAGRVGLRGSDPDDDTDAGTGEILTASAFRRALASTARRAEARRELLAVSVIELEGLEYIATAFGLDVGDEVVRTWRSTMAANAPTLAVLGEVGSERLGVVTVVATPADARRQAMVLYRSLFESLASVEGGVLPAIGIGVALSDAAGYDPEALSELAVSTATRASSGVASAVLLAEPR
ncbi:MAG: diguanylate cyclase [Microbacterium arborescens]